MKALGITRKIDELGRLCLPKELRDCMGINEGTPLEIFVDGESIILRKYQPGCHNCGSTEKLIHIGKVTLCEKCLNE
jgi:transcriptional pleiotropic regulator of transition state genes